MAALVACGGAPERPDGGPAGAAPEPVRQCFAAATGTFTGQVRLTVAEDGRVTGEGAAAIHDAGAGYYTSYHQALAGARDGDRLDVEVVTWIEEDRQLARETWTLEGGSLDNGRHAHEAADCGAVDAAIAGSETVLERLATGAGELTIGERPAGFSPVYTVRLGGERVRRIDAGDDEDELAAFPRPTVLGHFDPGVAPFDEVVLVQQHMTGNACNGGPLWLLGLRRDGSYSVSSAIDFCGGADPIVSREGERIRIEIRGGAPNRGDGYVPGETWVYEGGEVRRIQH